MKKIPRFDLESIYRWNEYNKAITYGKNYKEIYGVGNCIETLNDYRRQYEKEMENIINAEKKTEEDKYSLWKICYATRNISAVIVIVSFLLAFVFNAEWLLTFFVIAFFVTPVAAVMTFITGILYRKYASKLYQQISEINSIFAKDATVCYNKIDDLYLNSLEPTHREMVMMRREQQEHNRRMEKEQAEQSRAMRQAEQNTRGLLEIELERERERERIKRGY